MSSQNMSSSEHIKKENAGPPVDTGSLPESYGATEAYLLPRDPFWMFIYWEVTENSANSIKSQYGQDIFKRSKSVVRVHDITGVAAYDGNNSLSFYDLPVVLEARSWYINVPESGRSYVCELGLVTPDGRFIMIVRTNAINLPAGRVSEVTDERWMSISGDFEKLLQLSGVEYIGKGSGEVAKILAQRWEMLKAVFSRAGSWGVTSFPGGKPADTGRNFWLVADCELVLYGATEPDARVTVAGRTVKLNHDGTFSMRFAFPDGTLDLPVHATSRDEVEHRQITITAQRRTETDGKK